MGSFLSSIFGGSSPGLTTAGNTAGSISNFNNNAGQTNETDASNFYQGILSGDPSKIAAVEAPEIAAGQQQTQQAKNQAAEFGTRSGGTAATGEAADSANRANIINLTGQLQQGAAAGEAGLGENQSSTGLTANGQQAAISQEQLQNMMNSILGKGISSGAGALEGAALGAI
jgi:hypothetical protein